MQQNIWAKLLISSVIMILVTAGLVILSYYFIDKPATYFFVDHHMRDYKFLIRFSKTLSMLMVFGTMVIVIGSVITRAFTPLPKVLHQWNSIAFIFIVSCSIKEQFKHFFGRAWADTWYCHNVSLLKNNVYGFFPFSDSRLFGSFPSGHTLAPTVIATLVWLVWPRWRIPAVFIAASMGLCQIVLYFHFVSDVIAGAALGIICALYGYYLTNLSEQTGTK